MSFSYERQITVESLTGDEEYQRHSWLAEWRAFIARSNFRPGKKIVVGIAIFIIILLVILIGVAASYHGSTSNLPTPIPNDGNITPTPTTPTPKELPLFPDIINHDIIFTNTSSILLSVKNVKTNSSTFRQLFIGEGNRKFEDISTPFKNTVASLEVDLYRK